jgi:hypothetical protein
MKLTYAVSVDDFRAVYPPYAVKAGKNAGYIGAMVACGSMAALGLFCYAQGMGVALGGFLVGLGGVAAFGVHLLDQRSVKSARTKYDDSLAAAYRKVHCKDQRIFETTGDGFAMSCRCGRITRPWTELTGVSEGEKHLALATKNGAVILPRTAFPSGAELTELRTLALEKLKLEESSLPRYFDFNLTRRDLREARLLHQSKGGGWRALAKTGARLLVVYTGAALLLNAVHPSNPVLVAGVIGGVATLTTVQALSLRRRHYYGPLRVYFTAEGLQFQDPRNQSRKRWSDYIGYLESGSILLLYHNPFLYRVIPKRALGQRNLDFLELAKSKVPIFDYRSPESEWPEAMKTAVDEKAQSRAAGS